MIASIEWGENQTFKKSYSIVKVQMRLTPRRTSCPLSDYTILYREAKSNCEYWQKNYLFCRRHLCNFLYYIIYKSVRYPQTIRPYFVRHRKTAFLGKVNDYVLILARPGIITLWALYPHFVFLYGYDYWCFYLKIAIYSLKKLEYP